MNELRRRVLVSFAAVVLVMAVGTIGYYVLGGGNWSLGDCLYMTIVTVTTLGLESLEGFSTTTGARPFTGILLLLGIGTFLYFVSSLTALILESDLREVFRRKRMQKTIDSLRHHVIVCGVGQTGQHVVREMLASRTPFVAIDMDEGHVRKLWDDDNAITFPCLIGDAADDDVLRRAGIERARALVCALHDDKDNLYVVVTAREMNPGIRIVTRSVGVRATDKLRRAGADAVVSTNYLGGTRLAAEVLRPHVTEFLEEMLRERDMNLRIEEVNVTAGSPFAGMRLAETRIRLHTNALVLAIRDKKTGKYLYNPGPDTLLAEGTTLIVLLPVEFLESLRTGVAEGFS